MKSAVMLMNSIYYVVVLGVLDCGYLKTLHGPDVRSFLFLANKSNKQFGNESQQSQGRAYTKNEKCARQIFQFDSDLLDIFAMFL